MTPDQLLTSIIALAIIMLFVLFVGLWVLKGLIQDTQAELKASRSSAYWTGYDDGSQFIAGQIQKHVDRIFDEGKEK